MAGVTALAWKLPPGSIRPAEPIEMVILWTSQYRLAQGHRQLQNQSQLGMHSRSTCLPKPY